MGCCLNHEMSLDRLRAKAILTEDELNQLKVQKMVQEKKLALSEEARGELEKQTELLRQVLEDKEKEINDAKDKLHQAKDEAIQEYCDSDALLVELGGSFAEGFDNYLSQVKASYPDLDLSHVTIDAQAQTSIQLVHLESTDELFTDDAFGDDPRGDGDTGPVIDGTGHPDEAQLVADKKTSVQQQFFFFFG